MSKRLGIAILFLLAAASTLNAQKPNKFWSSGKLSWNDYTQTSQLAEGGMASTNSFGWETKDNESHFDNLTVRRITSQVYLNGGQSFVNQDFASDNQLVFNQLFFDLNELQCRKMLRDMYDPSTNYDAAVLQDYYIGITAAKMSEITIASDHGRDMETLAYYQAVIGSQLESLPRSEFNPKSLKKDSHGFGLRVGMGGEIFLGDVRKELGPAFVMDLGIKYYYKWLFAELQMGIGGLNARNDFNVVMKSFSSGDSLSELQACLIAGTTLYDGPWFRIAPIAGIGYNSMGVLPGDDDSDSTRSRMFGGMRYFGGLETDIKFSREASIYPDDRSISESGLNLRFFVARTGYSGDLDSFSLNFGFSYFFQFWNLKSW